MPIAREWSMLEVYRFCRDDSYDININIFTELPEAVDYCVVNFPSKTLYQCITRNVILCTSLASHFSCCILYDVL